MKDMSEQLLSIAEKELIDKESIRKEALASGKSRKQAVWKWAAAAAACFALMLAAVFAIPSARAEVFSWLGIRTPDEYLTADPDSRRPVGALDELIVKPAAAFCPSAGSVTENRVLFAADEPVWQSIANDFGIELGETLVDGESMYLSVRLHGLTALPELDLLTGGSATRTVVPPERLYSHFQNGNVPEELRDGSVKYWEPADTVIILILEDGTELTCYGLSSVGGDPTVAGHLASVMNDHPHGEKWSFADEEGAEVSRLNSEWLSGRSVVAAVKFDLAALTEVGIGADDPLEFLSRYADENGMLRTKVVYRACSYPFCPYSDNIKLEAEIGTACFDIGAFQRIEKHLLSPERTAALGSLTEVLSYAEWLFGEDGDTYAVTNMEADLAGVTFTAEDGAYIDGLGVHNVNISITFPDGWTEEQRMAFIQCLDFYAEANGTRFTISSMGRQSDPEKGYSFTFRMIELPYDMLEELGEVRLVPVISHAEWYCRGGADRTKMPLNKIVTADITGGFDFEMSGETVLDDGSVTLIKQN